MSANERWNPVKVFKTSRPFTPREKKINPLRLRDLPKVQGALQPIQASSRGIHEPCPSSVKLPSIKQAPLTAKSRKQFRQSQTTKHEPISTPQTTLKEEEGFEQVLHSLSPDDASHESLFKLKRLQSLMPVVLGNGQAVMLFDSLLPMVQPDTSEQIIALIEPVCSYGGDGSPVSQAVFSIGFSYVGI